jgi:hypothetical protein
VRFSRLPCFILLTALYPVLSRLLRFTPLSSSYRALSRFTSVIFALSRFNSIYVAYLALIRFSRFTLLSPALPPVNLFYRTLPCFTRFEFLFTALPRLCPTYPLILSHAHFSILSTFSSSCPPFCFRPPCPFMPRYAKLPRVYQLMLNLPYFLSLCPTYSLFLIPILSLSPCLTHSQVTG